MEWLKHLKIKGARIVVIAFLLFLFLTFIFSKKEGVTKETVTTPFGTWSKEYLPVVSDTLHSRSAEYYRQLFDIMSIKTDSLPLSLRIPILSMIDLRRMQLKQATCYSDTLQKDFWTFAFEQQDCILREIYYFYHFGSTDPGVQMDFGIIARELIRNLQSAKSSANDDTLKPNIQ